MRSLYRAFMFVIFTSNVLLLSPPTVVEKAVFGETHDIGETTIAGKVEFPERWTVFVPAEPEPPAEDLSKEVDRARARVKAAREMSPPETLESVPEKLVVDGQMMEARSIRTRNHQHDFRPLFGVDFSTPEEMLVPSYSAWGKMAHVFVPINSPESQKVTLGFGADYGVQAWVNGDLVLEVFDARAGWPPSIRDHLVDVHLNEGTNVLAVRFVSGKGSSLLALGGPKELRAGNFKSILADPFLRGDPDWTDESLRAQPGDKPEADIGTRRELFVDDFLVDALTGGARRRLHRPTPREVVHVLDQPWEGDTSAYFSVIRDGERILLYYNATPNRAQTTALIESRDGILFSRPNLGMVEFEGTTDNNLLPIRRNLGAAGHNFAPFKDTNPAAPDDQRYKAIAYPPRGGDLAAYASHDGIHWSLLTESIVGPPGPDSQNVAFWDPRREIYVLYFRRSHPDRTGLRGIWRAESKDFIEWTAQEPVEYDDERAEHMYTNAIRPYFRAPHIYIGTPARYVPHRKKVAGHPNTGVSDAVLMSSRDGKTFQRWAQAFIPPGPDDESWTERNNFPAWGMVQTSPTELSLYWTEHYRHPGMRLRRGTIRLDGFASLAAADKVGEMITRPLIFSGARLEVNYATSAVGAIRFELCDTHGNPYKGFALEDSDIVFGNEIDGVVTWNNSDDLSELVGQPVRLRVRLHDANLYSLRFMP